MMLLNNVVVNTLDARGRMAIFKTWVYCSDNVTLNKLFNLSKPWHFGHRTGIMTVSTSFSYKTVFRIIVNFK